MNKLTIAVSSFAVLTANAVDLSVGCSPAWVWERCSRNYYWEACDWDNVWPLKYENDPATGQVKDTYIADYREYLETWPACAPNMSCIFEWERCSGLYIKDWCNIEDVITLRDKGTYYVEEWGGEEKWMTWDKHFAEYPTCWRGYY